MHARFAIAIVVGVLLVTELHAQAPAKLRTDLYGDPLPEGAIARLGTTRWRHGSPITFIAFSPDGNTIAYSGSGGGDHSVRLLETATGKVLRVLSVDSPLAPLSAVFGPDGKTLTIGDRESFTLWDTSTGKEIKRFRTAVRPLGCLAFGPEGKIVAIAEEEWIIRLRDGTTGKDLRQLNHDAGATTTLAFSPDGRILASFCRNKADQTEILLWEVASGQIRMPLICDDKAQCSRLAFSPDGKTLAAGFASTTSGKICLWNSLSGEEIGCIDSPYSVQSLSFSPDGNILAVASDPGIFGHAPDPSGLGLTLWDVRSRKKLRVLEGHGVQLRPSSSGVQVVKSAAFAPPKPGMPSVVASGGADGTLRLWDPNTGRQINSDSAHGAPVDSLTFQGNGRILTICRGDRTFRVWDLKDSKVLSNATFSEMRVENVVPSPEGKQLAVRDPRKVVSDSPDGCIHIFDTATGKIVKSLKDGWLAPLAFTPDGKKLVCGDTAVRLTFLVFDATYGTTII